MDRNERHESLTQTFISAFGGERADLWTALPGIVQSFNADAETVEVQPTIQALVTNLETGLQEWVTIPLCVDCPVFYPSGGGVTLTFPIKPGDECLLIFASRCIDAWWQQGGVHEQAILRMHDLSDGFAFVGVRSQVKVHSPSVSTGEAQLRSDDGDAVIALNPTSHAIRIQTVGDVSIEADGDITAEAGGDIDATASGKITGISSVEIDLIAPTIKLNGVIIDASGNVTAPTGSTILAPTVRGSIDVIFGSKSSNIHTHPVPGVDTGTSTVESSPPS